MVVRHVHHIKADLPHFLPQFYRGVEQRIAGWVIAFCDGCFLIDGGDVCRRDRVGDALVAEREIIAVPARAAVGLLINPVVDQVVPDRQKRKRDGLCGSGSAFRRLRPGDRRPGRYGVRLPAAYYGIAYGDGAREDHHRHNDG